MFQHGDRPGAQRRGRSHRVLSALGAPHGHHHPVVLGDLKAQLVQQVHDGAVVPSPLMQLAVLPSVDRQSGKPGGRCGPGFLIPWHSAQRPGAQVGGMRHGPRLCRLHYRAPMEFDARDPAHEIDGVPFHTLARIRAEQPICPSPKGGWYLSTRRHIDTALKEVETFVADLAPMAGLPGTEVVPPEELFLSEIPEPRHGRIRRLYNSNFAPHRLRNTEEFVTRTCHRLLDPMLAAGEGDLHAGYAMPIPSATLADLMGLPPVAGEKFMGWSFDGTLMQRPGTPGIKPTGPPILDYFREALAERRISAAAGEDQPHDVIIGLMNAEVDGVPLTDTEDRHPAPVHGDGRGPHHPSAVGAPGPPVAARPGAVRAGVGQSGSGGSVGGGVASP